MCMYVCDVRKVVPPPPPPSPIPQTYSWHEESPSSASYATTPSRGWVTVLTMMYTFSVESMSQTPAVALRVKKLAALPNINDLN